MKRIYELRYKLSSVKETYHVICSSMKAVYKFVSEIDKNELDYAYAIYLVKDKIDGVYYFYSGFKNGSMKEPFKDIYH